MSLACTFLKYSLAPILLRQGKAVRRHTMRLPEAAGARSGLVAHAHHSSPLRLLVLGDSSAAGVGVGRQQEALALPTAQHLAQLSQRPVQWQLLAQSGLSSHDTLEKLHHDWRGQLQAADIVLIALGVNDATAQRKASEFAANCRQLMHLLQERCKAKRLIFSAVPAMQHMSALPFPLNRYLGCHAQQLDRELQGLCQQNPHCLHLPTRALFHPSDTAVDGFHPGANAYRLWAEAAARAAWQQA